MEKLVALTKRRGFIFQSSEIYGGINGAWDYGPLGVELKRNVKDAWWRRWCATARTSSASTASILMHPMVWKASGHVSNFADPMVDCKKCKKRYRVDEIEPEYETTGKVPTQCPDPKCKGELTAARKFNLMFETHLGPGRRVGGRRPTCGRRRRRASSPTSRTWSNSTRIKVPFGIAQIGKSFRNEINPRNFTFRSREFEQMELEFFCKPGSDDKWFEYWVEERKKWYLDARHQAGEAALPRARKGEAVALLQGDHRRRVPVPVRLGRARGHRQPHRLRSARAPDRHALASASGRARSCRTSRSSPEDAGVRDGQAELLRRRGEAALHPVRDRAVGGRRSRDAGVPVRRLRRGRGRNGEVRVVLRLHPRLAPIKAAVLPLVKKDGHARARAQASTTRCKKRWRGHVRRVGGDRQALPPPGRDRARRCASPSTATRSRTAR